MSPEQARGEGHRVDGWLIVVSNDHGGSGKGHGQIIPDHRT
jgi:hypothetical protein